MTDMRSTLDQASREWRRLGVLARTRADLCSELEADLRAASADGHPAEHVTGPDVEAFARDWAYARGDVPVRAYYLRAFCGASLGLTVGGLVAIGLTAFVATLASFLGLGGGFDVTDGGTRLLVVYVLAGLGCYLGAVLGVQVCLRQRNDPFSASTAMHLAWTLAVGMALALASGVGTATALDYPNQRAFVVGEVFLVAGVLSASIVMARRIAVGTPSLLAGPGQALNPDRALNP